MAGYIGKSQGVTQVDGYTRAESDAIDTSTQTFNRTGSDGTIVTLQKDGSTVGSIGTAFNDLILYSTTASHSGLRFALNNIRPIDNTGSTADDAIDLGATDARFQDLYLSGGVYLGGTGSDNKLDDYEEGTFSITLNEPATSDTATQTFCYVKIGRLVYIGLDSSNIQNYFRMDHPDRVNGNDLTFSGTLPFTPAHGGMIPAFGNRGLQVVNAGDSIHATLVGIGFRENSKTCYLTTSDLNWSYQATNNVERWSTITNLTFLPTGTYYTNE